MLSVIGVVIGNIELIVKSGFDRTVMPFGGEAFIAGLTSACCGLANLLWGWRLKREDRLLILKHGVRARMQFAISEMLVVVALLCSILAFTIALVRTQHPRYAEHVLASRVPHSLPKDASDVSYCQGSRGTFLCEFVCSENAFCDWVDSGIGSIESQATHVKIQPITAPVTIIRYTAFAFSGPLDEATVTNGLVYEWRKEDRGVHVVFDRSSSRGYYSFHSN